MADKKQLVFHCTLKPLCETPGFYQPRQGSWQLNPQTVVLVSPRVPPAERRKGHAGLPQVSADSRLFSASIRAGETLRGRKRTPTFTQGLRLSGLGSLPRNASWRQVPQPGAMSGFLAAGHPWGLLPRCCSREPFPGGSSAPCRGLCASLSK